MMKGALKSKTLKKQGHHGDPRRWLGASDFRRGLRSHLPKLDFSLPSAEEGAARFSGKKPGFIYTRMGNPTVKTLEDSISVLESGFAAMAIATGMAAISTVINGPSV
jgi:hypothetical protein